ncbi:MAG TPA: hypothetical protein HPP77_10585 [Candidatus Hydrogenedentes bacterium]|nr:hypothetical protein [Candidatus Hydrogenedentota bacterium]
MAHPKRKHRTNATGKERDWGSGARTRQSARRIGPTLEVRWSGFRAFHDASGAAFRRFYRLETLAAAIEQGLYTKERIIVPAAQDTLGPSPLASLLFELCQEDNCAFVFRVRAGNARRKRASLRLVVAKNHQELSTHVAAEYRGLSGIYGRAPRFVIKPLGIGRIRLPDVRRSKGQDRKLSAYVTEWAGGYHALGVGKTRQLVLGVERPRLLSNAQAEDVKAHILEIMARSYDAGSGEYMGVPDIGGGAVHAAVPKRGAVKIKLMTCGPMKRYRGPAGFVHTLVAATYNVGRHKLPMAPTEPSRIIQALAKARGEQEASRWLDQYVKAVRRGSLPESELADHVSES